METLLLQHLDAVGVGLEAFVDACGSVTSKEAATRGEGEEQGDEGQEAVWQQVGGLYGLLVWMWRYTRTPPSGSILILSQPEQVMDHLYAMEDFVAFSHLMVKRNLVRERSNTFVTRPHNSPPLIVPNPLHAWNRSWSSARSRRCSRRRGTGKATTCPPSRRWSGRRRAGWTGWGWTTTSLCP